MLTVILVLLILLAFGGGNLGWGGAYAGPGNLIGVALVVLLIILLVRAA